MTAGRSDPVPRWRTLSWLAQARALPQSPAFWLATACLCLHLFANSSYGVFRDELYFIVCGRRPDWGYVDQPPLIPWIAAAANAVFGVALTPLRLAPALAMTATVALTCAYTRLLGGGRFAQWLAGLCVLLAPALLVDGLLLSTDMFQPATWLLCSWALTRLAQSGDERWWIAFGIAAGVSLLSKYLIVFYVLGLAAGVVATPLRASLVRRPVYVGAAIALALAAPSLVWQASHGWPFLEIGGAGAAGKNAAFSVVGFLGQQVLMAGPAAAPVWIAGLGWLVRPGSDAWLRAIPIAYCAMTVCFVALHGKPYYLAPIYPTLFAAGAVALEFWLNSPRLRAVALGVVATGGLASLPLALPVLSPENYIRFARSLGVAPAPMERGAQSVLPQYFADMFGWREMAAEVSRVYRALPDGERAAAVFFGSNYGRAAAVEVYGPEFGGPPAIGGHNNYYLWGPRGYSGEVVIVVGAAPAALAGNYEQIETAGRISNRYAMPRETGIDVIVLRRPRRTLQDIWPSLKHYD